MRRFIAQQEIPNELTIAAIQTRRDVKLCMKRGNDTSNTLQELLQHLSYTF